MPDLRSLLHLVPNRLARLIPHQHDHPVFPVGYLPESTGPCHYCGRHPYA